ncbi:MAG: hypothetical protein KDH96_13490 [Candidatus Riesia sp.]|nr:hypothetical protein [Candidatus Riesia sp.]
MVVFIFYDGKHENIKMNDDENILKFALPSVGEKVTFNSFDFYQVVKIVHNYNEERLEIHLE